MDVGSWRQTGKGSSSQKSQFHHGGFSPLCRHALKLGGEKNPTMFSKLSGSVQDVLHLYHITSLSVGAYRSAPVHESAAPTLTPGEGAVKARKGGREGSNGVAFGAAEPLKLLSGAGDDPK